MTVLVFRVSLLITLLTQSSLSLAQSTSLRTYLDDNSLENFSLSLTTSLSETPVKTSSADHGRYYNFDASLSYKLPESNLEFVDKPSVSVSMSYSDEIGYEDNNSNLGNTTIGLSGLGYKFSDSLQFALPLNLFLATNSDDKEYRGYQGGAYLGPNLGYKFQGGALNNLSLSLTSGYRRFFYEYDATEGGRYNPEWSASYGFGIGYSYDKFSFSASTSNNTTTLTDGSKLDDSYSASVATSYAQTKNLSYGLSWSQRDRTFGYDRTSNNINFRYADLTLITLSFTYSI